MTEQQEQASSKVLEQYENPHVIRVALLSSLGFLAAFMGLFFGVKGPDDEWPYAWWSFVFLGIAFAVYYAILNSMPADIYLVRLKSNDNNHEKAFELYNYNGGLIATAPLSSIASVKLETNWQGKLYDPCVAITWKPEAYQSRRSATAKPLQCFVGTSIRVPLPLDATRLMEDFQNHRKRQEPA